VRLLQTDTGLSVSKNKQMQFGFKWLVVFYVYTDRMYLAFATE